MNIESYLAKRARLIEGELDRLLPAKNTYPASIHRAIRYSIFNGGKRVRPILALACAEACSGKLRDAMLPACALELIHTYSLIHDDLPCLDNDDYRRGRLTCHKKFGEAHALLTGDALLTLGFGLLGKVKDARLAQRLVNELSHAAGTFGMVGGQVVDKEAETGAADLPTLDYININKTGQLIKVSCLTGAIIAKASPRQEKALRRFGESLGLAFQVVDDIMDRNGYMKFMSEAEAREKARNLTERAKASLQPFGGKGETLKSLADFILNRKK